MAEVLNLRPPATAVGWSWSNRFHSSRVQLGPLTRCRLAEQGWASLQREFKCNGRFSCLFSDNRKQEQARKALEGALGGKKSDFEKWDKEIKKREEAGGGGDTGGGGWFRWGRWFGGSNGDHFWQDAQQTCLTILGIVVMYLIIAKGEVILAVIVNPLLFALRGTRNGFTLITSKILGRVLPAGHGSFSDVAKEESYAPVSAKDSVVRKWRNN